MTAASRRNVRFAADADGTGSGAGAPASGTPAKTAAGAEAPDPAQETTEVALERLIEVLETFRALDPDMPIQYALSFLTLARHEGMSLRELSDRLGIAQSSASRNVAALSEWQAFRRPGHDLVRAEEDPRERRRKVVRLTAKGRTLADRLAGLVSGEAEGPAGDVADPAASGSGRTARPGRPVAMPRRRKA